jgi:hypothetical protein
MEYSQLPAPVPSWLPAKSLPLCRLKTWSPSSASPAAALEPRPSPVIAILRSTSLDLALQSLVQLALCPAHCETRDRHRSVPPRLSAVPGSEESCTKWSPLPNPEGWQNSSPKHGGGSGLRILQSRNHVRENVDLQSGTGSLTKRPHHRQLPSAPSAADRDPPEP